MFNKFFHLLKRFNSLKYKILSTILIIIVTFTSLTIFLWYSRTSNEVERSSISYVNEILRMSNDNFDIALRDINAIITTVSINKENVIDILTKDNYQSNYELVHDNVKLEKFLISLYSYKHYFGGIMVSNLTGREFNSGLSLSFEQIKALPQFKQIINTKGDITFLSPHYYGSEAFKKPNSDIKDTVLSITKPIILNDTCIGIVVADVKCDILYDIFNINLKYNGEVIIIDNTTGEFIFKPEQGSPNIKIDKNSFKKLSDHFTSDSGSFSTTINGKKMLVIYNISPFTKWTTVGLVPHDKLLEGFAKTRNTVLAISFVFCIIAIISSFFISSILTKNLFKLNKAMKQVAYENLDIAIDIKTHDEIGQLYNQFNLMIIKIKELINKVKTNEEEKRKGEIKVLQAQINPHFLYNTLNTIKFLAVLQGADNIKKVSESLSILLHLNMEDRNFITVEEEVQYINSYLHIQKYKYSGKFVPIISVADDVKDYMVLKLLLQPIVENSIMHGISSLVEQQGIISIKIFKEENFLKLKVQDNGIGLSDSTIKNIFNNKIHPTGIGINNVISRIKLHFGDVYGVSILSEQNLFTIVEVSLPLITKDEVEKYV